MWMPTLRLAFARSIASGLVVAVLLLLGDTSLTEVATVALLWIICTPIGLPMTSIAIKGLNRVFEAMGLGIAVLAGNLMLFGVSLFAAIGDPVVYAFVRKFPSILEVEDFGLFNFTPAIFVLDSHITE